jgi:hypothetical protein
VSGLPVRHHVALEAQFLFQKPVQELGVLARIGLVNSIVAAHYRGYASSHSIGERPEIELVHRSVVYIRRNGFHDFAAWSRTGVSLGLLFVPDEMLCTSLGSSVLHTSDCHCESGPGEIWVWRETLPISASQRMLT